jgi:sortase A
MKKFVTLLLIFVMTATLTTRVFAANYNFSSGGDTLNGFGKSIGYNEPIVPEALSDNTRRNKDAAYLPPPYGIFSGEIPTDLSSLYHNNLQNSGFVSVNQNLPPIGDENYAPGNTFIASTLQTAALNTLPLYYDDGTIGTLYVARTCKTIKIYEGEELSNLSKGAGHFASTSAWDGNVALAGHNRGNSAYFDFVKDLQNSDKLTYTTKYGTRTYEVFSKSQINEYDNLPLSWSADNILTLITCVANVPELRYCAIAREVK